jgi:NAD(P)-dependent dehydrogenase (short-subunit alcohol dehydrogenase family)
MDETFSLRDKVAIVTGAGGGIGQGIAVGFAKQGAAVVAAGRSNTIQVTCEQVRALGGKCLPVICDVTVRDSVQNMVDLTVKEFGRLDIIVNNAGGIPNGDWWPMLDMPDETWDEIINLNLRSCFLCCQIAGRVMKEQRSGCIINVASPAGVDPAPFHVAYGASKAGVINLTRSLSVYLAQYNIRTNAVLPGAVFTEGVARLTTPQGWKERGGTLIDKLGMPEDIAAAAIYLASKAGDFVNGIVIDVTGGPRYSSTYLKQAEDGWKRLGKM